LTKESDDRLSIRRSWLPYCGGCVLALASFAAGVAWIARLINDPVVYVGGSRATPGRPVPWSQQSWGQHLLLIGCAGAPGGLLMLLAVSYVIYGAEDQRKPFVFDRGAGEIRREGVKLCKIGDVLRVRIVHARGGTGVFLRLSAAPWSVQLDGFSRLTAAEAFAASIAGFLRVEAVHDPIVLPWLGGKHNPPGFPVLPPRPRD
jgi:hypothetical protein